MLWLVPALLSMQSRSHPTTSANKMATERVVWYLWADSLVLAILNNSGQSEHLHVYVTKQGYDWHCLGWREPRNRSKDTRPPFPRPFC